MKDVNLDILFNKLLNLPSKKIYVAGNWEQREKIRKWMDDLESDGDAITEDWTRHEKQNKTREYAEADKKGIENCDWFIYDAEGMSSGKNIELGIALTLKKTIFIIGKLDTVFRSLIPTANFFKDWDDFLDGLYW